LRENGTVHFEFTPPVVGGDFAVLAASTPGDRWLEIRRRSTVVTTPPPPAAKIEDTAPATPPNAAPVAADAADVAELLSRFQAPETMSASAPAPAPPVPVAAAAPIVDLPPPVAEPPVHHAQDFDLSATMPGKPVEEPAAPVIDSVPAAEELAMPTNGDLDVPNIEFPPANPDFDLDGLTLPDASASMTSGPAMFDNDEPDQQPEAEIRSMGKSRVSMSTGAGESNRRAFVLVGALAGVALLAAGYWFVLPRFSAPAPVAVAAPPAKPRPQPKSPVAPKPTPVPGAQAKTSPPDAKTPAQAKAATPTPAAPIPAPTPTPTRARAETPAVAKANTPARPVEHAVNAEQPRSGFSVQVAAVRERDEADRIVARLVNEGYPGYLVRGQGAAAAFYRVRVGAFKDRQAAEEAAGRLERAEGVKPWIVRENP